IKYIRENKEAVKKAIIDKRIVLNLDELLALDEKRRKLIAEIDQLRAKKNDIAEKMQSADASTKERLKIDGKEVKEKIAALEKELTDAEQRYNELMLLVPNIPSKDTPVGGEQDFKVISTWGRQPKFDFPIKDHIELGKSLDILDLERGVKTAGFRGYYLKNEGALLHLGVLMLAFQKMVKKGFTPMIPPTLIKEFALIGSGHFPTGRQEIYEVEEYAPSPHPLPPGERDKGRGPETKFLVGTAEPSLLAYHVGETLEEKNLPVKLVGISPSYRREVGGYGKDTKGVYRTHEFTKVEQVVLCKDLLESEHWFTEMARIAQELLQDLKLPHRVIQIATVEMGAGKYKMYDIETWMPARGAYGETHSCSNLTDWQARRLNIKYRDKAGKTEYVHTLNNTVLASPRILIAILENNQQKDGSVEVPKDLRDFVGEKKLTPQGSSRT
ncbi:MAG: serine--tRNA ligase, partial [Candidatus Doudnabacteria bacterium]|nr:serine--tRNA ligase [Candidatus Doudnabacteria bacterium]